MFSKIKYIARTIVTMFTIVIFAIFGDFLVRNHSIYIEPENRFKFFCVKLVKNYAVKVFKKKQFLQHYAVNEHF
jgi:hypothetical protein